MVLIVKLKLRYKGKFSCLKTKPGRCENEHILMFLKWWKIIEILPNFDVVIRIRTRPVENLIYGENRIHDHFFLHLKGTSKSLKKGVRDFFDFF